MNLDAQGTLALMKELRRFYDRGCLTDAQLVYEALCPSLEPLKRRETWSGDTAQTYEAFNFMAWMAGQREFKPLVETVPAWLATWVVTTHTDLQAPPLAAFAGSSKADLRDSTPAGDAPPAGAAAAERDPIEIAVVGVILAGASLVLGLEAKIKTRQMAETKLAAERASGANRIRLRAIRGHMDELRQHLGSIRELGKLVLDPAKAGVTRSSIVFASAEAEEQFNQNFDRVTALVSRLNRSLSEIDPVGLPLEEDDVQKFVKGPIAVAEAKLGAVLRPEVGPHERIDKVAELLADYSALVEDLASAL